MTAILLVNLGTPRSPTLRHVYSYLNEFLTDSRVIDLPWWKRQLLVRGLIVPSRLRQSTHSYQRIWTKDGSPLMVYGRKVRDALQDRLGEGYQVQLAMRYQEPSIEKGLAELMKHHPQRLIVLPLFPQYASATTGSVQQKVMDVLRGYTIIPEVTFISQFARNPAFHKALAEVAAPLPMNTYDHILFSYHGLPQSQIKKADPHGRCLTCEDCCQKEAQKFCYTSQCHATTKGVVDFLNIPKEKYSHCFQSRLGRDPWLQPYASDKLVQLAREGKKRILVFCPSFVCDCLETLFEIGEEYGTLFKSAGGETLDLVPGLNDHPAWIQALQKIILS